MIRAKNFETKSKKFLEHSSDMLKTAHASALAYNDLELRDVMDDNITRLRTLEPHVMQAAQIAHAQPEDDHGRKYFNHLKVLYLDTAAKLCAAVDKAVDPVAFINACGQSISSLFICDKFTTLTNSLE